MSRQNQKRRELSLCSSGSALAGWIAVVALGTTAAVAAAVLLYLAGAPLVSSSSSELGCCAPEPSRSGLLKRSVDSGRVA